MKKQILAPAFVSFACATTLVFGSLPPSRSRQHDLLVEQPSAIAFTAAQTALPWINPAEHPERNLGPQKVLVIRVDFSDLPGESVDRTVAQKLLEEQVKPFIERVSFGQATIVPTVSSKVYRMPLTAERYAHGVPDDGWGEMNRQLYLDAETAARADYPVNEFTRVIVAYSDKIKTAFPDMLWEAAGGFATLHNHKIWIGTFNFATVTHEILHTFGATHCDLWYGTAVDPLAYNHVFEYGDKTDIMGRATGTDSEFHPWNAFRCGWLPAGAVKQVTTNGTYRVFRHDYANAPVDRPLLLQVSRDGVFFYGITLREGSGGANGRSASISLLAFGGDTIKLIDAAVPYQDDANTVLEVGQSLVDSTSGTTIRVVASGGQGRDGYIDVEVQTTHSDRPSLVGWGSGECLVSYHNPHPMPDVTHVVAGGNHTLALRKDGTVWVGPEAPTTFAYEWLKVPAGISDVVSISAGKYINGVVKRDGSFTIFGDPKYGRTTPPPGLTRVRALAFGLRHALALTPDGTVVSWGDKTTEFPEIGNVEDLPVDLHDVVAISAGNHHSVVLKRDGTVAGSGWGGNRVQTGYSGIAQIASNGYVTLGLKADGTVVVLYGSNFSSGQMNVPAGLAQVKMIAVGENHCAALKADGSVVSWGCGASAIPSPAEDSGTVPYVNMLLHPPAGIRLSAISAGFFHSVGIAEAVGAPMIIGAAVRTNGKVTLSWSASERSVGYRLDLSPLPTFAAFTFGWENKDVGTGTSVEVTGLDPAATYYYRVSSVSADGYTSCSNIGIVAPAAAISLAPPLSGAAQQGGEVVLAVDTPAAATCQWLRNGTPVGDGVSGTLRLANLQPSQSGVYLGLVTNGSAAALSAGAIVGVQTSAKVIGTGAEVGTNIVHPNGNVFDQVKLTGKGEAITADYDRNRITRTSFLDLSGDIVQVELSGPGTLSVVMDEAQTDVTPTRYHQPGVDYTMGHAGLVITGADERTNVSVFTVGRATAFDPTGGFDITKPASVTNNPGNNRSPLFEGHETTEYDGVADIAFIAILSTNGKFGGIRSSNARYYATKGTTGVFAPGVEFTGPVYVGNICAYDTSRPYLLFSSAADVRITGGDMLQDNGQPVAIGGIAKVKFTEGSDSHGHLLPARLNSAVFNRYGADVTTMVVAPR